jgi:hypothetical protein
MSRNLSKLVLTLIGGLVVASGAWAADCTVPAAEKSKAECAAPAQRAVIVKVLDAASGLVMKDDGQIITLEHEKTAPVRQDPMIRVRGYSAPAAPQMVTLAW